LAEYCAGNALVDDPDACVIARALPPATSVTSLSEMIASTKFPLIPAECFYLAEGGRNCIIQLQSRTDAHRFVTMTNQVNANSMDRRTYLLRTMLMR